MLSSILESTALGSMEIVGRSSSGMRVKVTMFDISTSLSLYTEEMREVKVKTREKVI